MGIAVYMDETASYLKVLGLREQPFAPTADPGYFYATREHKECLFRLWSSIDNRHGIAVVLGNYGTGKTTLLRKLIVGMAADPEKYCTAVLGSPIPSWTSFALLEAILAQFGVQSPEPSFVSGMETLNRHLLENRNRICTLIIDYAQNLNKRGQIELLRLVQNLETQQHKLLNMVLFAQMEWTEVLRAAPNFEQRVNMTYTLQPMQFEEMRQLIAFRIEQAAAAPGQGPQFDEGAMRALHAYSEGSPRVVINLCRNVLLLAAQLKTREIGQELVLHTIEKTTMPDAARRARVAAALGAAMRVPALEIYTPMMAAAAPSESPSAPRPVRRGTGRDQRAAQILLNAIRDRETKR
jgi:general secretion pathway protein A